jgi:delta24-sterol reductase
MGVPSGVDRLIEHILINYRFVFVCFFLLPASLLYEIYSYWRNWIIVKVNSAPKLHHRKVKHVQKQVSNNFGQWYGKREKGKPCICPGPSGFLEKMEKEGNVPHITPKN